MTRNQIERERIAQSARLNEIASLSPDDFNDAIRVEASALEVEYRATGDRLSAMLAKEDGERRQAEIEASALGSLSADPEVRERLALRDRSTVGAFVAAALNSQAVIGVDAEYAASVECAPLGQIPISIFDRDRPEVRAVSPGVDAVNTAHPTAPFVFERSVSASVLGIQFPVVPPGVANYPVISTGAPSGAIAKDGAAVATAAAVRLDTRSPKRIAGSFTIRVEDIATMPSLESDLRVSLMASASNAVDEQVIAGSGTAPALTGLFKLAGDVSADSTLETFATGVKRFASLVDGQYASSLSDLRAIIGSDTFGTYSGLFAGNGSMSLADYLMQSLGGFAVSNRVPVTASSAQKGLVLLSAGEAPNRVPIWSNMELIVDPYSNASKGQRVVTVTTLVSDPHLPYGASTVIEIHPKIV